MKGTKGAISRGQSANPVYTMRKQSAGTKAAPRTPIRPILTPAEVEELINRVRLGMKQTKAEGCGEEPGLTQEARSFVIRF